MYCCNRCIEGKLLIHYYLCFVWRELIFKLPMTIKCVLKKRGWEILPCTVGTGVCALLKLSCLCSRVDLQFLSYVSAQPDTRLALSSFQTTLLHKSTNWEQTCVCVFSCVHSFALNITSPSWYRPCKHCILEQPPVCILLLIPVR